MSKTEIKLLLKCETYSLRLLMLKSSAECVWHKYDDVLVV